LIALITNAHRSAAIMRSMTNGEFAIVLGVLHAGVDRKDQFCFKHIREPCGQARPTTENAPEIPRRKPHDPGPNVFPLHDVRYVNATRLTRIAKLCS